MSYRKFTNIRLAGVSAAVPGNLKTNQEMYGDSHEAKKIAGVVGIKSRYVSSNDVCTSDLCFEAADQLLDKLGWERDSVDALIFLSQTPDYLLPATSCVLQKRLNLSINCAAFDMSLGCSGYIYGLLVAYGLIAPQGIRRVLLLVGDTISKVISPDDMPANILFGDAGTATAIEFDEDAADSFIVVGTDGKGSDSLIIEAGGFRKPKSISTSERKSHVKDKVLRTDEELYMDGSAVFSFTLSQVPGLISNLLKISNHNIQQVDYWLFHQANKFMLDYLAKKIGIPSSQMLMNIDRFGNTSPPSIPLLMVSENLQQLSQSEAKKIGLTGFGVGFSWGAALLEAKNLLTLPLIVLEEEACSYVS